MRRKMPGNRWCSSRDCPGGISSMQKCGVAKLPKTWKFDSIPFNYLVGPDGRILAKAIKPDSVMYVLNKFVK
jgi:hypothetical protein